MLKVVLYCLVAATALAINVYDCSEQSQYSLSFSYIDGQPDATTTASLCHDSEHLYVRWASIDDEIIAPYQQCNDPLYNADAVEVFIATPDSYPYQYFELEVSPNSKLFFADISNPTGDCSSLGSVYEDCGMAEYEATTTSSGWNAELKIRLDLIGRGQPLYSFKINLLRIDVSSSRATRFLTWRPTFANPPCFHVPAYFE